jgi:hypothetical protein
MGMLQRELQQQRDTFLQAMNRRTTYANLAGALNMSANRISKRLTELGDREKHAPRIAEYNNAQGRPLGPAAVSHAWAQWQKTGTLPPHMDCCDGGPHLRKAPWSLNQYYDIQDRLGTEPLEQIAKDYGTERLNLYWELVYPAGDRWRIYQFSAQRLAKELNKLYGMRVTNAAVRNWFTTGRVRGYYEQDVHMRAKRARYTNAPQPKTERRAVGRVIIELADYMWLLNNYKVWMQKFPDHPGQFISAEVAYEVDLHDKAVAEKHSADADWLDQWRQEQRREQGERATAKTDARYRAMDDARAA